MDTQTTGGKSIFLWIIGAVIIALALWGMVKVASKGLGKAADTQEVTILPSLTNHEHEMGSSTAKVTFIEYADFECPACGAYYEPIKNLVASYGNNIRFVYRHFPLSQHQSARIAALASEAAAQQGKFWEMHDKLFETQTDWAPNPDKAKDIFIGYAKDIGLNMTKFNADLASTTLADKIEADRLSGVSFGVNQTPSFYINNNRILNPQILKDFIDTELAKNGILPPGAASAANSAANGINGASTTPAQRNPAGDIDIKASVESTPATK